MGLTYDLALRIPTNGFHFSAPGFITSDPQAKTDAGVTFQGAFSFPVKCVEGKGIEAKAQADAFFANVYMVEAKGSATMGGKLGLELRNCQLLGAQLTGNLEANGRATGFKQIKVVDLLLSFVLDPGWVRSFLAWLGEKILDPTIVVKGELALVPRAAGQCPLDAGFALLKRQRHLCRRPGRVWRPQYHLLPQCRRVDSQAGDKRGQGAV